MPKYTFECGCCSLRFSRSLKMGEWPTHECPSCKEEAPRLFEGFGFAFQEGAGTAQANTGVHGQDYPTADMAVGRSAEKRWATYREREKVKKEARKVGSTHALIRTDGEGYTDYAPMSSAGRNARAQLVDEVVSVQKKS